MNLKELSPIIKVKVIDKLDHKNLNLDVDFMKNKIPSTENLAIEIWNQLQRPVAEMVLVFIVLRFMKQKIIL